MLQSQKPPSFAPSVRLHLLHSIATKAARRSPKTMSPAKQFVRLQKRARYLHWPDYFMATAFLTAQRSKDPSTQVGAVIVNAQRRIVGVGYNGFPIGCSDDAFPWHKSDPDPLECKYMYVCHAETNAILNKNSADVAGCTMYVALFPCNECAKIIIQSGIRTVCYLSDKHGHKRETQAAKRMFRAAGVRCERHVPAEQRIRIDFDDDGDCRLDALRLTDIDNDDGGAEQPKTPPPGQQQHKRTDYLSWPDYFMAIALLAAQRSKDPSTQVGACIVNAQNKVVGVGYNGFPNGCSDDEFPWTRETNPDDALDSKYLYVCHAEVNAILNKNAADVNACTIYVALFPCNECAKFIIQAGIRTVVYLSDKYAHTPATKASRRMFAAAGVRCEQFRSDRRTVVVDFADIERRNFNQLPATPQPEM